MTRVVAIIQARTGSTRLPRKVLLDLKGRPMLERVVERVRRATLPDTVVVATTTLAEDDSIVDLCESKGYECFRGSRDDVLDRYYRAARQYGAGAVVRVTSDCPLIDPGVIDLVIGKFLEDPEGTDYSSNIFPVRTFPRGLDVEVIGFPALETSFKRETDMRLREHVTQYIIRHPAEFSIVGVRNDRDFSGLRWTVDTPEDFACVLAIYHNLPDDNFVWNDILGLLERMPGLCDANKNIRQKEIP